MGYINLLFNLYQLKTNTSKTREEIESMQRKKLYGILEYAYNNSKYYKKAFEESGIKKNKIKNTPISKFPTIDKKIVMENYNDILTVSDLNQNDLRDFDKEELDKKLLKGKYHVVHSSGSTGTPFYFVYDKKAWEQMLLGIIRGALWDMSMKDILKLLWEEPKIAYIAATDGRYGGAMAVGDGVSNLKLKQIFLDIKTPLTSWIKSINEFKPNIIIGYPSAIKILGKLIENKQVDINVTRVISCGEPLGINLRKYFEEVFKTDIINIYGASESLALGVEKNSKDGMYLFDDLNYIEIENGTMYLTSLYNFAQPLIRYKISDKLTFKEVDEKVPFSKVESLVGRNEDIMWFGEDNKSKEFIHPLAIEGFCIEGMKDYQFRKIDNKSFEMLVEAIEDDKKQNIEQEMQSQMRKILLEKNLGYINFKVNFVDKILPNPKTGKKPLVIT